MARALTAAVMLLSMTAHSAYADDTPPIPDDIAAAADDAGIDPVQLAGAVNSTGTDVATYLCANEGIGCPKPSYAGPPVGIWDRLAQCESTGNWAAHTGNGYYGGLQEDMTFWRNYGGLSYAARPDLASRAAQIAVAQAGQARQGWSAWPVCSRVIGLR